MCDVTQSHFFWVTSKELVCHILSHLFFFFSIRVLFSPFKFLTQFLESHNAFMQVSNTPLSQTLQMQISLFSTTITTGSLEQVMNQKYQKWLFLFMMKLFMIKKKKHFSSISISIHWELSLYYLDFDKGMLQVGISNLAVLLYLVW